MWHAHTHTRARTHARTQAATAQFLAQHVIAVVSCCCWSLGPSSSRYQSLNLFSAPLPDPPNWERLWLRKRELNRQREREREREQILVWKKVRTKEWATERRKRARPVQASARQVEDGFALNSWPHESRTSFLPSALYLLLAGHEPNRAEHNVVFQYSVW